MPGKYADDSTSILLRLPKDLKARLYEAAERLNKANPGANYSASSMIRAAIIEYLDKMDEGNK
jgi:predicted transcriptional regulator